eukprot:CAMPEP_0173080486 /NCGR_PEP_ID=MMETSP1102-20130122/16322_1 /TAXON_ID=49646 /ORGANISM="Geminigera sp., Strain Caron Lab Isolate" /LENGTH=37 /DNA_ID= /DNA_START= /DNA_END= /DNA_ORIENTATION=
MTTPETHNLSAATRRALRSNENMQTLWHFVALERWCG